MMMSTWRSLAVCGLVGWMAMVGLAPAAPAAEPVPARVAMVLWRGETEAERGFVEALKKTPGYDFTFDVFDAGQDKTKLQAILDGLDRSRYGLIYTFGMTVTQYALRDIKDTPVVFNIVSRPVEGGIIRSWEHSGNNATGAANTVPMASAFKTLALVLNIRKLGFLYTRSEANARIQEVEIQGLQEKFGFQLVSSPMDSADDISGALKKLMDAKVDAVLLPSDSMVTANAGRIVSVLNRHKIPSIVTIPEIVRQHGALLSIGPDYHQLGALAADNALQILSGKKPTDIPSRTVNVLSLEIHLKTADMLGVTIPIQLLSMSKVIR